MKKITNIVLVLLTFICIYIILNVGLGWLWPIGSCSNSERVNQVLINLSYSYLAGLIFYFLVSYLPSIQRRQKLLPAIRLKMNDLYYQINGCIQTFEEADNPSLVDSITSERLSEIVMANDMFGQSFYAKEIGINQSNIDFLARTKSQIFELIDQILTYKDYLTEEQILAIERIHDSRFFNLVSNPQDTPATRAFFSSNQFKEGIIEELGGVISDMKQLKRSVQ